MRDGTSSVSHAKVASRVARSRLGGAARVFARALDLTPCLHTEAKAKQRR